MKITHAATTAAAGLLGALVATSAPAGAWPDTPWITSTAKVVNGSHVVQAQATWDDAPNGLLDVANVRSAETTPLWDTVCSWQGYMAEVHDGAGIVFEEYSSFHSGCNFMFAIVDWQGWFFAMPETGMLRAKWRSDATPQGTWMTVGNLVP